MPLSVYEHYPAFWAYHGELAKFATHGPQFLRRVTVAGEFLPALFALERGGAGGLGGLVFRQSNVSWSEHGFLKMAMVRFAKTAAKTARHSHKTGGCR